MRLWRTHPWQSLALTHGHGCTVVDVSGKPYLDLLSGTWCNVLGYGHPRWVAAIREQAGALTHTGASFATREIDEALCALADILPPQLDRAVLLNTGSEAVELALKIARAATAADGVAVIERGYYGATTYALALSEAGRAARCLPSFEGILRLPAPDCRRCPMGRTPPCGCDLPCLAPLAALAEGGARSIAAVLYEPVMGSGILVPPERYGARLRELASRCGALLIAEEVTTGMGRTGRWFAVEHEGVVPDVLVIGKALGAGLPVSAVVTTAEVETRAREALGRHVQSHQNDPFSGRNAATVISILRQERLIERAAERGDYLSAGLRKLQIGGSWIAEVRGMGAMVGFELRQDRSGEGGEISRRLLERGFIVDFHIPTSTFRLFPPFVITTREIDAFLQALGDVMAEMDDRRPAPTRTTGEATRGQ